MPRYFIEVSYKGTNYSGFQIQQNANTIQAEVEKVLQIFFKKNVALTGSSRTDAGVHALQNFFHFDIDDLLNFQQDFQYNLNALLPRDIVINRIFPVNDNTHCRFDAISREYKYYIYQKKDPFLEDIAFYYPYKLDLKKLNETARLIINHKDFTAFSKQNTQVKNFICNIEKSEWHVEGKLIIYNVIANRFLRGMVKGLVGTILRVGTSKISLTEFCRIIENKDCTKVDFSPPSHGLFLNSVKYNFDLVSD